jgi:AraC-like DNA-binding protein
MPRGKPLQTRLLFSQGTVSPLGRIKLVGTIRGSQGTSRSRMRLLDGYALVYLLRGGGEYEDASGMRRNVQRGDLIWLFPDLAHRYGPTHGEQWDEIYFMFEGPLFELWHRQKIIGHERPIWRLEPVDFWYGRLEEMTRFPSSIGWEGAFHQLSQFQNLVADMLLASRNAADDAVDQGWLAEACQHLQASDDLAPGLEEIARRVGLSYESFRKKFTERMGVAPAKYRQARVIERACGLLMRRSHSHKEIAEQLGFCDEFHFSKAFRHHMGLSPRAFRLKVLDSAPK